MSPQIHAYLNFNGNCREAMTFYHQCLGGELVLQKVSESPMAARMPSEVGSRILHSQLSTDHILLMGSDMIGDRLVRGNGVGLCLMCFSEEQTNDIFARLSQGGDVITPLHQSYWGATYGELRDRFGLHWMFNFSKT